ncbi:MAG: ferrochelatase [Cytophagales bacterium]|nr:ferrochelatase [Cytophagales bacterium]
MAKSKKTGVLLVNLGTPDSPKTKDVRKYLREFLMDERVIDIPSLPRFLLVNGIIAPFRSPKSAKEYQKVWTDEGSPLLIHGLATEKLLQEKLGKDFIVSLGMRYQSPSIRTALDKFKDQGIDKLIVVPLYPQYASATTGSSVQKVYEEVNKWQIIPTMNVVNQFLEHPSFINAWIDVAKPYLEEDTYHHYVFSYHGLPERQIKKGSCANYCQLSEKCCSTYHSKNQYCYRAQCFETTRLLTTALGIKEEDYTVCFQSRLGKDPWIQPYTEDVIHQLVEKGKKKVLAFSPAFVSDCLETTIEVGEEYRDEFLELGGEKWQLVDSLNSNESWIQCLQDIVLENC